MVGLSVPAEGRLSNASVLTVEEAARVLRIGRSLSYQLAREYLDSGGASGLPVIRVGSCLRVPRWALMELAQTGRVVRLSDDSPAATTSDSDVTHERPIRPPRPRRSTVPTVDQLAFATDS